MRCWTIFVLLLCLNVYEAARPVTNEDIRDAILSVVNMIRSSEDKLERHEFREKTLGDQVKKLLWAIDKRQRLDPVKGTISRLDERLAAVETILLQKDERERIQMQKIFVMTEQMHNSLPQLFETLKNDVTSSLPNKEYSEPPLSKDDLAKLQKEIETKIGYASNNLKNLEGELTKIREDNKNHFSSNQKFLEKYESKLTDFNKQIAALPGKYKEASDLQTGVILKALEAQRNNLKQEIIASNALTKNLDIKLLQIEAGAKDNHRQLNETTNQHFENVKLHCQEVLKKYEAKANEHNKKIDLLPSKYKSENELQTKSILKALETQSNNLKQEIIASNALAKDLDVKLLRIEAGAKDNHRRLNESSNQHFENVKLHSEEVLKKYEEKVNKKIDFLPSTYKNENELQTKSILKAFEKQHDDVQKAFLNQVVKNCEIVDKHLKEAFPQQKKALDDLGGNLVTRFNLLNKKLDDDQEHVRNKIETSHIAVQKMQNASTQTILNSLSRSFETTNFIKEALGDQKTVILSKIKTLESGFEKNWIISKEIKQNSINVFETQEIKFDEMFKEIRHLNASHKNFTENVRDRTDAVIKALEEYRSKTEQHLLNTIRDEFVKAISKRIDKASDKHHNDFDFLRSGVEEIIRNVSDVYKAIVRQEGKMETLSQKLKTETDLQSRALIQAIESLNNQTVTNIIDQQSLKTIEVVSALHEIERNSLNTTVKQSKNIQNNLEAFLQAFEKELVFVTNAATSDLKDHVDRTSTIELQEFNAKFDALSSSLSNENSIIQERKRDMRDFKNTILEQTKMIETVMDKSRDFCKGTGDTLDDAIRSIHDLRGRTYENFVEANKIAKRNEQRLIELHDFLKEDAFQNNRDLQNKFILENLTMGLEQYWNEISSKRFADCNNHTDLLLREIKLHHEKMHKTMEITYEKQINNSNAFEELNNKSAQFVLKEIELKNVEAFKTVTEHLDTNLKELVQKTDLHWIHQNTSGSLRLLRQGLDALTELVSLTNDKQTESLVQAIENSGKSIKQQSLLFGNALVSIQTSLSKLHENHMKQGEISSDIKEEIRSTNQLIDKCSNRTNVDNVLKVLRDYGSNITKQLERSEDKLVTLNKEYFGNISRLINDTRKDYDDENVCKISALINKTYSTLIEKFDKYDIQNDKVRESMKMIEELTEALNGNIAISFERLIEEVQGLQRLEEIVTQIGDGVTETKRRIEYGVREISMDIGNLIKSQTKDLSTSVNSRFDNLHLSCTANNDGALANITTSLTNEFDHVWRQIGIMHQEMTLITETLNKLENNTRTYMNSTNDNIEQTRVKVSLMQSSMIEMDRNLNMLLRRISADIKRAVLDSLNEIKPTPNFAGPGPHIIRNQQNTPRLVGPGPHVFQNQQNNPKLVGPSTQPNIPKLVAPGPHPVNM